MKMRVAAMKAAVAAASPSINGYQLLDLHRVSKTRHFGRA